MKKTFLLTGFLLWSIVIFALDRYLVATGNWNATSSWSATDGGASGASAPIAGDNVFMTSNSSNFNVTLSAAAACATITTSGTWSGQMIMTNTLTHTGNIAYPVGSFSGTADFITVTGATIDITPSMTGGYRLGGTSQTYTLSRNLTMAGTLTFNGATAITFSGNFTIAAGAFSNTMTVSAITMSGAINISGNAVFDSGTSTTISGGQAFTAGTCTVSNGQTMTITNIGSMTVSGLTTSGSAANVFTGGTWNTGGITTSGATTGTTLFNITGGTVTLTAALSCSMTFAGNITWASATNLYAASGTPTLTYTSGTITVGTSVLSTASSFTVSGAMPVFSLTLTAAQTITCNGILTGTGTLTLPNAAVTFDGSSGWTFANVTSTAYTAARTTTFQQSNEYIITTNVTSDNTDVAAEVHTWTSAHASTKTKITLQYGCTQDLGWFSFTRVDGNNGHQWVTFRGTVTDCFNVTSTIPPYRTSGNSFGN